MSTAGDRVNAAPPIADHMVSLVLHTNEKQIAVAIMCGVPVSSSATDPENLVNADRHTGFCAPQNRLDADLPPQNLPVFRIRGIVARDVQPEEWQRVEVAPLDDD